MADITNWLRHPRKCDDAARGLNFTLVRSYLPQAHGFPHVDFSHPAACFSQVVMSSVVFDYSGFDFV